MYKYICKNCNDDKPFYTWFEPILDNPAFCPCCGRDDDVEYVEEVEDIETTAQAQAV